MVPARGVRVSRASKVIRFGAVGVVATATDFTLFNLGLLLLAQPGRGAVIGINTLAFAAATLVSYQLNSRFTFTAVRDSGALARYLLVALGGAAVYNGSLFFALQFIAVEQTLLVNAAKMGAVVLSARGTSSALGRSRWSSGGRPRRPGSPRDRCGHQRGHPRVERGTAHPLSLDRLLSDGERLGITEVIVVDDGSTDRTATIVGELASSHVGLPHVVLLRHPVNHGKGAALRTGLMAASQPMVGYLDADLSIGPAGFQAARDLIASGAGVVVGYRISYTGEHDGKGQPVVRRLLSLLFKRMQRRIVGLSVRDTQCPFKLFTREAARQVVPECHSDGWAFDVEVLLVAARAGIRIAELPVQWLFVGGSTVRADAKTAWRTLRDLILVRLTHGAA